MEAAIEFAEVIVDIMGKKGPVKIDTLIAAHNLFLEEDLSQEEYDKLRDEDVLTIGREGKAIGKADVRKFLDELHERKSMPIFDNDRTYVFEGAKKDTKVENKETWGEYYITWGS